MVRIRKESEEQSFVAHAVTKSDEIVRNSKPVPSFYPARLCALVTSLGHSLQPLFNSTAGTSHLLSWANQVTRLAWSAAVRMLTAISVIRLAT